MTTPSQHFNELYGSNAAENYERFFVPMLGAPLAAQLVEMASLRSGERVLDVACGTGIVARLAAERVAPNGTVAGLDLNPGMLAVARDVARTAPPIEWHQSSAEAMPLPDAAFDVVFCQLSLQFFPDKAAALREMRRVLTPGGRLLLSVPGPTPRIFAIADEALGRHIGPEAAGFVRAVFSLHDPREVGRLLREAGFRDVDVRSEIRTLHVPPPREFLWQYVTSTPLGPMVAGAGEDRRNALETEVVAGWEPFVEGDRLTLDQSAVVATARK
jgi:ubiquinone/menaquinone biosynthesis C-methylase UbiE